MRTIGTTKDALLDGGDYAVHTKVWLKPSGGSYTDVTDLEGYNWVYSCRWGDKIDSYVGDCEIQLWAGRGKLRLAPLMNNSKLNKDGVLADSSVDVKIETATVACDVTPQSADWDEVFVGRCDRVSWSGNPIVLQCRDQGEILDAMIESQAVYPNDNTSEAPVEDIIQQLLDDTLGAGVVYLYSVTGTAGDKFKSAESPGFIVRAYVQKRISLAAALKVLVDQTGWQIGYKWNTDASAFKLTLYDPGREVRSRGTIDHSDIITAGESMNLNGTAYTEGADFDRVGTALEDSKALTDALDAVPGFSAWTTPDEAAIGTMTFTDVPDALDSFTIVSTTLTEGTDWTRDAGDLELTIDRIVTAINDNTTLSTRVRALKSGNNRIKVTSLLYGALGNLSAFTESMANCTFDGSGNLGGSAEGRNIKSVVQYDTVGTAGDAIVFTESFTNATIDGGGFLGGTIAGADVTVARTFGSDNYKAIKAIETSKINVRNAIEVTGGRDPEKRWTTTAIDQDSIDKHRRRFMAVALDSTGQIDTESEGKTLAYSILDDLKTGDLAQTVELDYFAYVELGDVYTFSANGVHYDTDQTLAVIGYSHNLGNDGKVRTTLRCKGKPSGGLHRWLRLERRGGLGGENADYKFDAPAYASIGAGMSSIEVEIEDPRLRNPPYDDWKRTRIYVSTSSGFTPSSSNLKMEGGRQTKFTVTGLTPGTTYYVKLSFVGKDNAESYFSPEIGVQTQYSAPYHENPEATRVTLNQNPNFAVRTLDDDTELPDGWELLFGDWNSEILWDNSVHKTGNRSIRFDRTAGLGLSGFVSSPFPIAYGTPFELGVEFYWTGTSASTSAIQMRLQLLDKDQASLGYTTLTQSNIGTFSTGTWHIATREGHISNSSARYARVDWRVDIKSAASADVELYVDKVYVAQRPKRFRAYDSSTKSVNNTTWTTIDANAEDYDWGYVYNAATYTFTAQSDGLYALNAAVLFAAMNAADWAAIRFNVGGGTTYYTGPRTGTDQGGAGASSSNPSHSAIVLLSAGDTVTAEAWQYNVGAAARTYSAGTQNSFFMATRLDPEM